MWPKEDAFHARPETMMFAVHFAAGSHALLPLSPHGSLILFDSGFSHHLEMFASPYHGTSPQQI